MPKIVIWNEDTAQKELRKRLQYAEEARRRFEARWEVNERTIYRDGSGTTSNSLNYTMDSDAYGAVEDIDNSESSLNTSYSFKNLRFLHAQMSANPPSVVVRPTSNEQSDRTKADAADRLVRHAIRQYRMQERVDKVTLNTLLYGTGFMKITWDPHRGDILEADPESGEITLEGDLNVSFPSPWKVYMDPDAETPDELRYLFEEINIPFDEALFLFGEEARPLLEKARVTSPSESYHPGTNSALDSGKYDAVSLFEYWETGLPSNGFLGRHCLCTREGQLLGKVGPNPHRFISPGAVTRVEEDERIPEEAKEQVIRRIPQKARLPYHILTDIDVPGHIWGKSFIEYVSTLQDTMNRLDSTTLDNVKAHGLARLVLPEGAEIADDSITNSPWDIIKMTGSQPPHFVQAPRLMPEVQSLREQLKLDINEITGVNESMFGQQSREQSGFSMQYATNQGNMIRRRLFNKYAMFIEDVYKSYLSIIRKYWDVPRVINVLGTEKAIESVEIKGADVDGGFDLVVEYGTALSLDPMTRREEIMGLQPLFEKAGVPMRVALKMMKLNELEGLYDMMQLAEDRQREIFEVMIATGRYIPPEEFQDHENMMAYAFRYFMMTEFGSLDPEVKELLRQHIRDRAALAASEAGGGAVPGGGAMDGSPLPPGPAPAAEPLPQPTGAEDTGAMPAANAPLTPQS